jgi:hypothetical protein
MSRRVVRFAVWAVVAPVSVATAVPQAATTAPPAGAGSHNGLAATVGGGAAVVTPAASVTSIPYTVQATPAAAHEVAAGGVPRSALRAYRVAESALRIVDPACRLSWDVLAGIGGLESDHGRRPSGRLGPMRMVPAVWRLVGVDGDADGRRDPRDMDDAALAAATYLCAGTDDLGTEPGRRAALLRYNRSPEYADLAMRVAVDYEHGVDHLPPLAAVALGPDGPGVEVGVGTPGRGVLIGGSDNVTEPKQQASHGHAGRHRADQGNQGSKGKQEVRDRQGHGQRGDGRPAHGKPGAQSGRGHAAKDPQDKPGQAHGGLGPGRDQGNGGTGDSGRPRPSQPPKPDRPGTGQDRPKPPQPTPSRPPRPGAGDGAGTGGTEQPTTSQYTGVVQACDDGYCLGMRQDVLPLVGRQPFADYLDQEVVVTGVLRADGTLKVSAIAPVGA